MNICTTCDDMRAPGHLKQSVACACACAREGASRAQNESRVFVFSATHMVKRWVSLFWCNYMYVYVHYCVLWGISVLIWFEILHAARMIYVTQTAFHTNIA